MTMTDDRRQVSDDRWLRTRPPLDHSSGNPSFSVIRHLSSVLCFLIHLYRYTFASVLGGRCRFTPGCSAYALDAIAVHGPVKGSRLALGRICRCHPWGKHGFDPVPPRVK